MGDDSASTLEGVTERADAGFSEDLSKLGLAPGEVKVEPHSSSWSRAFELERERLAAALGDLALGIEHVGSTAVPELCAKPILDIAIAVADDSVTAELSDRLAALGYRFAVDAGSEGGLIFFRESDGPIRTHHVHVVRVDDWQWRNYLRFRDRLREDPKLREDYAALKRRLARRYARDREGYTAAKTEFVTGVVGASPRTAPTSMS